MTTAEQIHEIAKDVMGKGYDFDYIGIRIQEDAYGAQPGREIDHCSHVWDDGEMLDEETNGVCAVSATLAAKKVLGFGAYSGNVILVIGSNSAESGEDDGEIILRDAYGSAPVILDIIHT